MPKNSVIAVKFFANLLASTKINEKMNVFFIRKFVFPIMAVRHTILQPNTDTSHILLIAKITSTYQLHGKRLFSPFE